jgi:methylated-DNA-[protein]-cysteine S-methyltransferase
MSGQPDDFRDIPLDYDGFTDFRRLVTKAARAIPYGMVASYRELAELSGKPKAVRAVGTVMRRNPWPIVVPCHRVISSGGNIGGYCGATSGKWIRLKERFLALEGISTDVTNEKGNRKRNQISVGILLA